MHRSFHQFHQGAAMPQAAIDAWPLMPAMPVGDVERGDITLCTAKARPQRVASKHAIKIAVQCLPEAPWCACQHRSGQSLR